MRYKKKNIGTIPTLEIIEDAIKSKRKYSFTAKEVYDYYTERGWKTKCNRKFSDVEVALGTYYNMMLYNERKRTQAHDNAVMTSSRYAELLKDPRWFAFRDFIFAVRGCKCEKCGAKHNLQVHHPRYRGCRKPWEYNCKEVVVLCRSCHQHEHFDINDLTNNNK